MDNSAFSAQAQRKRRVIYSDEYPLRAVSGKSWSLTCDTDTYLEYLQCEDEDDIEHEDSLDEMEHPPSPYHKETPIVMLNKAFAKYIKAGGTKEKWCKATGRGKNYAQSQGWLDDPSTMTAHEVEVTCELFSCTLDYLQYGMDDSDANLTEPDGTLTPAGAMYWWRRLNHDQREILTATIAQFLRANNLSDRIGRMDNRPADC